MYTIKYNNNDTITWDFELSLVMEMGSGERFRNTVAKTGNRDERNTYSRGVGDGGGGGGVGGDAAADSGDRRRHFPACSCEPCSAGAAAEAVEPNGQGLTTAIFHRVFRLVIAERWEKGGFWGHWRKLCIGERFTGGGGKSRGNRAIKPASRLESNGEEGKRIVYGISAKLRGVYTNRHYRRTCALAVFPQPTAGGRRSITDACVPRCPATTRRRYARHRRRRLRHSRRRRYNNLLPVYGYYDRDDRCDTDCNTRDTNNDYTVTIIQSDNDRGNGRKKTATPFARRPHRVHRCIYIMYILYLPRWSWSGPG